MKIGNINYPYGLFLAPMAGITDRSFRFMCKKYGVQGMVTEMISAKALVYDDKKTKRLALIGDFEQPCGLQLFGSSPDIMAEAAIRALQFSPAFIDINMGCPAPKIVNNGEGSALMKKPDLVYNIVKEVSQALLPYNIPVTVKIRRGFDKHNINALEIALLCEKAGASAVFVHARTRDQMYLPPIYPGTILMVKKALSIPVIGNGDINDSACAIKMIEETGCDGVMIGRAAMGNPYIFSEILSAFQGNPVPVISNNQKQEDMIEHLSLLIEDKGEYIGIREARKHMAWYLKGFHGSAALRAEINTVNDKKSMINIIKKAFL